MTTTTRMCPFCPILLPHQQELWNTIGPDFFGEPAEIGGVPSCGDCAAVAAMTDEAEQIIRMLKSQNQEQSA